MRMSRVLVVLLGLCVCTNALGQVSLGEPLGRCCFLDFVPEPASCQVMTEADCLDIQLPSSWTEGEDCQGDPCNTGEPFSGCGELGWGPQSCILFHADSGETFAVDNLGGFLPGARVEVSGIVNTVSFACFPVSIPVLEDNTIEACPEYFSGCGRLGFGPQSCILFHADTGETFAVDNLGGFLPGATVWASGIVNPDSSACFPVSVPALEDNAMGLCFLRCGRLVQGTECVLFEDQGGDLFVLEDLGDFQVGDSVVVTGCLNPNCFTICQRGNGCVEDNTIAPITPGSCFHHFIGTIDRREALLPAAAEEISSTTEMTGKLLRE